MQGHRVDTRVSSDGSLTIKGLPFPAGDEVEVIIRSRKPREDANCHPLCGKPVRYVDLFGSVAGGDWEALK